MASTASHDFFLIAIIAIQDATLFTARSIERLRLLSQHASHDLSRSLIVSMSIEFGNRDRLGSESDLGFGGAGGLFCHFEEQRCSCSRGIT